MDEGMNLFEIISKLDPASSCEFQHVKFGRIQGMSTRKGTAVFLSDILNEAKERMLEKMQNTPTTKVTENLPKVAEILGISATGSHRTRRPVRRRLPSRATGSSTRRRCARGRG